METGNTGKGTKHKFNLAKSPIFIRIMIAGLLPTVLVFVSVFMLVGNSVYRTNVESATERAMLSAQKASQLLSVKLLYLPNLVNLSSELLLQVDKDALNPQQQANNILLMFIEAYPDICNAWFIFEEGIYSNFGRFTKSYMRLAPGQVREISNISDQVLADPELSPWYHKPVKTGQPFLYSLDYYDYGPGIGTVLVDSASAPIIEKDGRIIGCVGFAVLFDEKALGFIQDMEISGELKTMIIRGDGMIMYSTNEAERYTHIGSYEFENLDLINSALETGESFVGESFSPFFNKESLICLYPVELENDSARLYFYQDTPTDILHKEADNSVRMVGIISVASLMIALIILYLIARNIVRPIRGLTESANKIAGGKTGEAAFQAFDENETSNNEVRLLGSAIKKMLAQLNEAQALKLKTMELTHKKEKAEAQAQATGEFLAHMSHEIRTPMNSIIGVTELLLREELPAAIYEHVLSIKSAGNNLLSIINDILDISKIKSGKLEIIDAEYMFASLINDVVNIIRVRTSDRPVFFVVNLSSIIPDKLLGDEARLRQILINVLGNALKYTREGFISLDIDGELQDDNTVLLRIDISDSGIGIKPGDMDKIFGSFEQVNMNYNRGVQGTGLGLAITKSLCQAMGGDISVRSAYGRGSTFSICIPQKYTSYKKFAAVEKPHTKKVLLYEPRDIYADSIMRSMKDLGVECVVTRNKEAFAEALHGAKFPFVFVPSFLYGSVKEFVGKRKAGVSLVLLAEYGEVIADKNIKTIAMPVHAVSIANILNNITVSAGYGGSESVHITFAAPEARVLVVDDIAANLKVAQGLMAPYNMQIDACLSGAEAIMKVKANKYDIIFMDHMMPDMDGLEATKRIRALEGEYFASVPIVALTANAISGVREMFLQHGMNDYLAKPIETAKLNNILEQWIPREKRASQTPRQPRLKPSPLLAQIQIEGLDVNAGLAYIGGDINHYLTTLSLFHKDGCERAALISNSLATGDTRLYTTHVHALKSVLASLGGRELSIFAQNLEDAGRRCDTAYMEQHTATFLQALTALLDNVQQALAGNRGAKGAEENMATEINTGLLLRLQTALAEMDAQSAGEIIKELQAEKAGPKLRSYIERIYENFLLFEYEEAQAIINTILKQTD